MFADPETIHNAVLDTLRNGIDDDYNWFAYPMQNPPIPAISVWPAEGTYIAYFGTFGPNGLADMMVRIRADVGAIDNENVARQMWRLHATGEAAKSSVVEAINRDPTLGGVVQECKILTSEWPIDDSETSGVSWWPAVIIFKKDGAAA